MSDKQRLLEAVDRALALANAALEEPSADRLEAARHQARALVPQLANVRRLHLTLAEADRLMRSMHQLQRTLAAVEHRPAPPG